MNKIILAAAICLLSSSAFARDPDMSGFPKWIRVVERERAAAPRPFVGDLKKKLDALQAEYREVPYVEDFENFCVTDYWATRQEMAGKGSGDCEDFAIAEYFDLVEAGVPEGDMEVVVVTVRKTQELHAVLRVGGWVLDRRAPRVMTPAEFDRFYRRIYGINRAGWAQ